MARFTNAYHFVDRWRVKGTVEEVADVFIDPLDFTRWWPSTYREIRVIEPGDDRSVGQVGSVRATGWLPYKIHFTYRVVEEHHPHGFTIEVTGDLTGRGEWRFKQDGEWVDIVYEWIIAADKPVLRYFSFLLKPIFRSNHNWTMRRGEASLKRELARRHAANPEEGRRIPPPPGPFPAAIWLAVGALLAGTTWWGLGRRYPVLRTTHSTVIRHPVKEVFAFITNVENDLKWQPEILEVVVTSKGQVKAGSTFREVRRVQGRTQTWDMLITEFEPNRRICIKAVRGTVPYRGCRTFEAVPGGTRITEVSEGELPWFLRPFTPLIARVLLRSVRPAYNILKRILEA